MFDPNSCRAMQSVAVDVDGVAAAAAVVAVAAATSEMQFQLGKHRAIFLFFIVLCATANKSFAN